MIRFSRSLLAIALLLAPCAVRAAAPVDLEAMAREAAGQASHEDRARARSSFFAALPTAGPDQDARLHHAWTGYLLATDDQERKAVLDYAASLPTPQARMLVDAFRGLPSIRKDFSAAEKAHAALLAQGIRTVDAAGKPIPPKERYGVNALDARAAYDLWEDAEGFTGRWGDKTTFIDVSPYPSGNYEARLVSPSTPGVELLGFVEKGTLTLLGPGLRAVLKKGVLTLYEGGAAPREFGRIPVGVTSFADRPKEARVLLDSSTGLANFRARNGAEARWIVLPDGAVEIDPPVGSIWSRDMFGDVRIYLEFRRPFNREALGPRRGNSGVYVMNVYEIQIVDSFGTPPSETSEGSIYHISAPAVQASAPPLEWQSYLIEFRAPRFGPDGVKTAHARLSVWHNGIKIQDNVEVPNPTAPSPENVNMRPPQPLLLQNHGNRVQYRNIWVLPLEPKD